MTVGNVVALAQSNLKRMLAYSSIAHVGYMLVGWWPAAAARRAGVLFYLLVYTFTTVGAFGAILLLARTGRRRWRSPTTPAWPRGIRAGRWR